MLIEIQKNTHFPLFYATSSQISLKIPNDSGWQLNLAKSLEFEKSYGFEVFRFYLLEDRNDKISSKFWINELGS